MNEAKDDLIVLFDGYCNLCSNTVRFILKFDRNKKFKFASLQSEFAQSLNLKNRIPEDIDSVLVIQDGQIFYYSASVFKILKELGFPFYIVSYLKYLPKKWMDGFYKRVAKNRYSWFGQKENCFIPDNEFKNRFR